MKQKMSEQEILAFLENRAKDLKLELKRLEDAMKALQGNKASSGEIKDLVNTPKPITSLTVEPQVPSAYNTGDKWDNKLLYMLTNNGPSFKEGLADAIIKLEPDLDLRKLLTIIAVRLSVLYKSGHIQAERAGKRLKYFI
jgi:hypothetical protein